jgi:hypothetical protein
MLPRYDVTMTDCATCRKLIDDWQSSKRTLRQMRHSVLVWDYSRQTSIVETKRATLVEHRSSAHPEENQIEIAAAPQPARRRTRGPILGRPALVRIMVLVAALAVVLLAAFLRVG